MRDVSADHRLLKTIAHRVLVLQNPIAHRVLLLQIARSCGVGLFTVGAVLANLSVQGEPENGRDEATFASLAVGSLFAGGADLHGHGCHRRATAGF